MILLDGKSVSLKIKEELKQKIEKLDSKLKLVVISVGENEASKIYIKKKQELADELGVLFEHLHYDEVVEKELLEKINTLNNDSSVTGILVQLPLPSYLDSVKIVNSISYVKDVDGITAMNFGLMMTNNDSIIPCTAKGIMALLDEYKIDATSLKVAVVGRSNIVGKPLSYLFLKRNATITICHSKTANLKSHTIEADILVSATGCKYLIKKDMVKKDSIIVDVGITRDNGKLYGDVDFENVKDEVSYITPVPGGVGPLTVVMLMSNLVDCYLKQETL